MEMASKERIENGVVITVYTESVTTRSRRQLEDPTKKTKPCPNFRSNGGYDRRALLLAHSRDLRNEGCQNVPSHTNQSRPKDKFKLKGIWLTQPWWRSSMCGCERVVACKESKERNPSASPFLSKMKITLKQLSCKKI